MNFYSVRDLRNDSKKIWEDVRQNGEVVITNNGKPSAMLVNIPDGQFESILRTLRRVRYLEAFNRMRTQSAKAGYLSDEEIEAEIQAARKEMENEDGSAGS